jgi:hypothetical protein
METNLFLKICGIGALLLSVASLAQANTRPTQAIPAARSYLCFEGGTASDVTRKANEAGTRGWRMVAASGQGAGAVWCFEQFDAARPREEK